MKTRKSGEGQIFDTLAEYIETGQYFKDARFWYRTKFIYPFSQRSFVFILSVIICVLFSGVAYNINNLFPVVIQVKYSIKANSFENKTAKIIRANQIENNPLASITDIFVRNYVLKREQYDYDKLKSQFVYMKNSSTRIVFRRFYNFMNIDNPSSPVMRFQKFIKRNVEIVSASFIGSNKALVKFVTTARDASGNVLENMVWQTTISFEIDKINPNLPAETRFHFTVTDYQLKLLKDRTKK